MATSRRRSSISGPIGSYVSTSGFVTNELSAVPSQVLGQGEQPLSENSTIPRQVQQFDSETGVNIQQSHAKINASTTSLASLSGTASFSSKSVKETMKVFQAQVQKINSRHEEDSQLVELVRDYFKKKGEIEAAYLKDMEKLTRSFVQKSILLGVSGGSVSLPTVSTQLVQQLNTDRPSDATVNASPALDALSSNLSAAEKSNTIRRGHARARSGSFTTSRDRPVTIAFAPNMSVLPSVNGLESNSLIDQPQVLGTTNLTKESVSKLNSLMKKLGSQDNVNLENSNGQTTTLTIQKQTHIAFHALLMEEEKNVKALISNLEKRNAEAIDKLKELNKEKASRCKKITEQTMKIHTDINAELSELEKTKKSFEQCSEALTGARQKYEEIVTSSSKGGLLNNLISSKEERLEKAKKKYTEAQSKFTDARNEYVIQTEIVNALQAQFHQETIQYLLGQIDADFFKNFTDMLNNIAKNQKTFAEGLVQSSEQVETQASLINADQLRQQFLFENQKYFNCPAALACPVQNEGNERLVWNHLGQQHPIYRLASLRKQLNEWIQKKEKEIKSLISLRDTYRKNPSFGNAEQTVDAEAQAFTNLINAQMSLRRVMTQIELWSPTCPEWQSSTLELDALDTGDTNLVDLIAASKHKKGQNPVEPPGPRRRRNSVFFGDNQQPDINGMVTSPSKDIVAPSTEPKSEYGKATALYDYEAKTGSELDLYQDAEITVLDNPKERTDGWLKCRLKDKEGLAPANYLSIQDSSSSTRQIEEFSVPKRDLVRALYEYNATVEGELSLKVGDYIIVTNKQTGSDEWWEGTADGKSGQFPRAYVEEISQMKNVKSLFAYKAETSSELGFEEKEPIQVVLQSDDQRSDEVWIFGISLKTGNSGLLPKSYII